MKLLKVAIALIMVTSLVGCLGDDASSVKLTSPLKTCKTIQEQYTEKEAYTYEYQYEVVESSGENYLKGLDWWGRAHLVIRNLDSSTGKFTARIIFKTLDGETTRTTSGNLMSGEIKDLTAEFDVDAGEDWKWSYSITPPSETRYNEVIKYRDKEVCE